MTPDESDAPHPRHDLDPLLNSPVRLSIVAALASVDAAEFRVVRNTVGLSDSALSKQVSRLETVGYVAVRKDAIGRYARTWLRLTRPGRSALARHLDALHRIAG
ncbi:winged helix-turn-helix domain-containing protein [Isoptericola jiangsuensis]|uniref:winged helix-turn-helix domain-containing protein n=1 Tax=Isoptericola jiangsuensis TaxID=548579 RepID=UPI003AAC68E7